MEKTIIIWADVVIIILISIFAAWLFRQWRIVRRKNLMLVEQINLSVPSASSADGDSRLQSTR